MNGSPNCQVHSTTGRDKRTGHCVSVYAEQARDPYELVAEIPPVFEEYRWRGSQNETPSWETSETLQTYYLESCLR